MHSYVLQPSLLTHIQYITHKYFEWYNPSKHILVIETMLISRFCHLNVNDVNKCYVKLVLNYVV
jgi:hypothetical protein